MRSKKVNALFHSVADEGNEITAFRRYHKKLSKLPAHRIEIILKLAKLKQYFLSNKL